MASAKRVLVTRAAHQGSELAAHLQARGLEPAVIPAIELAPPSSFEPLDRAIQELASFDWLLFTSANAVEALGERLAGESPAFRGRVAAIGPATARALEAIGLSADLVPAQAVAEALTEALLPLARQPAGRGTRFLLIRAEQAREHLPDQLIAAGAEVVVAPAYRTVVPQRSIEQLQALLRPEGTLYPAQAEAPLAAITFTSSSTARNLAALCASAGVELPPSALRVSIGPITSGTLRELGLAPHVEAREATVASLAEAVTHALGVV